ncbi:MFS transporter, partial [Cohnella faecalis]|uniref:MFS transporter n=1 Tax=Cohnella faecalis TaxID=2315694 RepID=UPI002D78E6DF
GAFSLFWTVAPLRLADDFGMSQQGIAWFALAGVGGAIAAPIAGRLADKGWSGFLTGLAMIVAVLSFLLTYLFKVIRQRLSRCSLLPLLRWIWPYRKSGARTACDLLFGSEARGRLNGLFMSIFFIGGAIGSSLGGWSYAHGGWSLASLIGIVMPLAALLYFFTEKKKV